MRIERRKNGDGSTTVYVDYADPRGRRVREKVGRVNTEDDLRELERHANTRLHELRALQLRGELLIRPKDVAVSKAVEDFLKHKAATVRPARVRICELALRYFQNYLATGTRVARIGQVKGRHIHDFVAWLKNPDADRLCGASRRRPGAVSEGTVSTVLSVLETFFNRLENDPEAIGHTANNPMKTVGVKDVKRAHKRRDRKRIFTDRDLERVLSWTRSCGELDVADFLEVLADSGLRSGEVANLWWSHVDLDRGAIRVEAHGGWQPKVKTSTRTVPIPNRLRVVLMKRQLRTGGTGERPVFTFYCRAGRAPDRPYYMLRRALRALDLDFPDANGERLNIHSFRHTYCTRLANSGVPVHKVQRLAGHTNIQTTQKYFTVADADLHDDIDRVFGGGRVSNGVSNSGSRTVTYGVSGDSWGQRQSAGGMA